MQKLEPILCFDGEKFILGVSPYRFNVVSVMHERGKPFPKEVKQEYNDEQEAIKGLIALKEYYDKPTKTTKSRGTSKRGIPEGSIVDTFIIKGKRS